MNNSGERFKVSYLIVLFGFIVVLNWFGGPIVTTRVKRLEKKTTVYSNNIDDLWVCHHLVHNCNKYKGNLKRWLC